MKPAQVSNQETDRQERLMRSLGPLNAAISESVSTPILFHLGEPVNSFTQASSS